ncbi:MAG: hypothetical protein ACO38P_07305 [Phycisphaerales bacterium]
MHLNATDLATLRTLAEAAVEAASRATRAVHDLPGDISALLKDDRSPVTIADFEHFCATKGIRISRRVHLLGDWKTRCPILPNLFAGYALYELTK